MARWRKKHGIVAEGLSEKQLATFRQAQAEKQKRECLRNQGKKLGMSADAIKKLFLRKKKPDGTPDWEAIEAHINRRGSNAATEDAVSLEEQIATLEALLAEPALGSQEREEVLDKLRQLRQRQQGIHP